jgi:hypothetical protein
MTTTLVKFNQHLNDPAPTFRCVAAGKRKPGEFFLARVRHRINPEATHVAKKLMNQLVGQGHETLLTPALPANLCHG